VETSRAKPSKNRGILVTRGVSLRIPAGGLKISLCEACTCSVQVNLNIWLHWLEIAMSHLEEAQVQHEALLRAREDGREVNGVLEGESRAAMQAVMAAAIAIDALYATAKDKIALPPESKKWRQKGTARYAQVTEVFRRAFCLKKQSTAYLRGVIKELYRFRDLAVHPPGIYSKPVLHPDLCTGVEWRFVTFSFNNARQLVRAALAYVKILPSRPMDRAPERMQQLAKDLLSSGEPLFLLWEERYGTLLDQQAETDPT